MAKVLNVTVHHWPMERPKHDSQVLVVDETNGIGVEGVALFETRWEKLNGWGPEYKDYNGEVEMPGFTKVYFLDDYELEESETLYWCYQDEFEDAYDKLD